jgi:hypothetical protein
MVFKLKSTCVPYISNTKKCPENTFIMEEFATAAKQQKGGGFVTATLKLLKFSNNVAWCNVT